MCPCERWYHWTACKNKVTLVNDELHFNPEPEPPWFQKVHVIVSACCSGWQVFLLSLSGLANVLHSAVNLTAIHPFLPEKPMKARPAYCNMQYEKFIRGVIQAGNWPGIGAHRTLVLHRNSTEDKSCRVPGTWKNLGFVQPNTNFVLAPMKILLFAL